MAWTTPKTDWTASTFINYQDINRILGNLRYLKDLASHLYANRIPDVDVNDKSGYGVDLYADEVNKIEKNLLDINNATLRYSIGTSKTFQDNGAWIDYVELNRIESATLQLYTEMTYQHDNLDRLAFTLGGERKFKI